MAKLTDHQLNIFRLIKRSQADENGWYRVSATVWPHINNALPDDLVETRSASKGGLLRLTERGRAVADYI